MMVERLRVQMLSHQVGVSKNGARPPIPAKRLQGAQQVLGRLELALSQRSLKRRQDLVLEMRSFRHVSIHARHAGKGKD